MSLLLAPSHRHIGSPPLWGFEMTHWGMVLSALSFDRTVNRQRNDDRQKPVMLKLRSYYADIINLERFMTVWHIARSSHLGRILLLCGLLTSCASGIETPILVETNPSAIPSAEPMEENTPTPSDLDLQEANVLDVRFERLDDNKVRFDVTLLHDDVGESPSFADSWQVEDLVGTVLGERILAHSHGTTPFTRSATIQIPEGMDMVVVRGHDMEHGFGGQAALVNMTTSEVQLFDEDNEIAP